MKLILDAEELCTICMIAWPGPLPPFKGVQGILPDGVKNVVKWRSQIGLQKLAQREQRKLMEQKIWGTEIFEHMMIAILFYQQAVSVLRENKYRMSFFEAPEGFASITFLGDTDKYEVTDYPNRDAWMEKITAYSMEQISSAGADVGAVSFKVCKRDDKGKTRCNMYDYSIVESGKLLKLIERV